LGSGLAIRIYTIGGDRSGRQDILGSGGGRPEHDVLVSIYTRSRLLSHKCVQI